MGMPISTYTVIRGLSSGDLDSYERNTARKALASFRLFAFIIHDPEAHPEFDRFLSHNFDEFDYITGPHFLFFALVDPPKEWLRHARGRGYYEKIRSRETEQMLRSDQAIVSADSSLTAFTLATSLNIPTELLPCLIVTDNFQADQFVWVKTCKDHIREQLQFLGYVASRSKRPVRFERSQLDLCDGWGTKSLTTSLADTLTDLLSFIVTRRSSIPYERHLAQERASHALKSLSTSLQALKETPESDGETFDRLCVTLSTYLAHLADDSTITSNICSIPPTLLEQDSYQILRTAYKVLEVLLAGDYRSALMVRPDYDFTPAVVCFAKVFERESNFSLVHWIRKELGISLPAYFNKPQPGIVAKVQSTDFNANRGGSWLPPGIGKSEFACLKMAKTRLPAGWDQVSWDFLTRSWKTIRERRNEAAHVRFVSEEPAYEVKNSIEGLAANGIFDRMYRMKTEYRGNVHVQQPFSEPDSSVLVLGFNFNAELQTAEDHFAKGHVGECLKAIGKLRPYVTNQRDQRSVNQLEDRASVAREIRLNQIAQFSDLLDRVDLFLKEHCPLCGKELAGATRCWEQSCEPLWNTVKNLGLFRYRDEGLLNLSDVAFAQLLTFLKGLKIRQEH